MSFKAIAVDRRLMMTTDDWRKTPRDHNSYLWANGLDKLENINGGRTLVSHNEEFPIKWQRKLLRNRCYFPWKGCRFSPRIIPKTVFFSLDRYQLEIGVENSVLAIKLNIFKFLWRCEFYTKISATLSSQVLCSRHCIYMYLDEKRTKKI